MAANTIARIRKEFSELVKKDVSIWCYESGYDEIRNADDLPEIYEEGTEFSVKPSGDRFANSIVSWNMMQMPACCGIALFTGLYVNTDYRKKGIGTKAVELIKYIAKKDDYKLLMATDIADNEPMRAIWKKLGFDVHVSFKNRRTENRVCVASVKL